MMGPASVMGLGFVLRLRSCKVAAAMAARPSSGTSTSRRVRGRASARHNPSTAAGRGQPGFGVAHTGRGDPDRLGDEPLAVSTGVEIVPHRVG